MNCVEISARIIRWPNACACCCQRPDTAVEIHSTRVTGKRVIHTQTKSWEVPYCRNCLAHIRASQELQRFSMFVPHLSVFIGLVGASVAFMLLLALLQTSTVLAVCLSVLAAAATAAVMLATYRSCQENYERAVRAKQRRRRELEDRLTSLLHPECTEEGRLAAQYGGWYGSIHTFYFSSATFARFVEGVNPGKCLRSARIHHGRHD